MPAPPADAIAVPSRPGERILARRDGLDCVRLSNNAPAAERALGEQLARRAMKDTPFNTPAFTTADTGDVRLFVAREHGVAVGLAVLRPRPRWAWWSWDDWDDERRPATGVAPLTSWTVETIWIHSAFQGRGLSMWLLDAASADVDQPIQSFGWHRPFTPSGEALVRRCCPEGFWVPD